jgi:hypothetical protein
MAESNHSIAFLDLAALLGHLRFNPIDFVTDVHAVGDGALVVVPALAARSPKARQDKQDPGSKSLEQTTDPRSPRSGAHLSEARLGDGLKAVRCWPS